MRKFLKLLLTWTWSVIHSNRKSKLLYYHDICNGDGYRSLDTNTLMGTNIELFKKHMRVIKEEGYTIVPKITAPEGEVSILLDDGFRGIWENRHFFYDNNIQPTIFLPVDYLGQIDKGILSIDEVLELQEHGFIFECHSWSHCDLSVLSRVELKRELLDSKKYLSRVLGKEIQEICLPIGYFSDILIEEIKKYNYKEIYSSTWGAYDDLILGCMRSRNLCQFASPFELKLILRGGYDVLRNRDIKMHYNKNVFR